MEVDCLCPSLLYLVYFMTYPFGVESVAPNSYKKATNIYIPQGAWELSLYVTVCDRAVLEKDFCISSCFYLSSTHPQDQLELNFFITIIVLYGALHILQHAVAAQKGLDSPGIQYAPVTFRILWYQVSKNQVLHFIVACAYKEQVTQTSDAYIRMRAS